MSTVKATDIKGNEVDISLVEFQRAIINYLQQYSPTRAKVIAETVNTTGTPEVVPAAICMLAKNPEGILHYIEALPLVQEKTEAPKPGLIEVINDPEGGDCGGEKHLALVDVAGPLQMQITHDYDHAYINLLRHEAQELVAQIAKWLNQSK